MFWLQKITNTFDFLGKKSQKKNDKIFIGLFTWLVVTRANSTTS